MPDALRLAVLISGSGSNLEAILKKSREGGMPAVEVAVVISSQPGVFGLERAGKFAVPIRVVDPHKFHTPAAFDQAMVAALVEFRIDVIALAGYLKKLGVPVIQRFQGRILNIHPALLPKFGGAGMYGHFVHEAVLRAGEKESGCSVHLVDEEYDRGPVIAQARVPVEPGDSPERLAERILQEEHRLYPETIQAFCGRLKSSAPGKNTL